MKKFIPLILLISILPLFSACGAAPEADTLKDVFYKPYTCKIAVNDGEDVYSASVTFDGEDSILTFSDPAILCGTGYGKGKDGGYIVYNDLKISLDENSDGKIVRGVSVWHKMMKPDKEYGVRSSTENNKKVYIMSDGKTEYVFDAETDTPVNIKDGDITITFTEFIKTNDKPSESAGEDLAGGT
jgi:hypothetical protein